MTRRLQPSDNGPAIYRWLIGNGLIEAADALNDNETFGSRIEWVLSVGADLFGKTEEEFQAAYEAFFVDAAGRRLRPGDEIPRTVRLRMVRELIRKARAEGVFDFKAGDFSDATSLFEEVMDEGED